MEWIKQHDPIICCPTRASFQIQRHKQVEKIQGQKKFCHANINRKRAGLTMLNIDKIDFKTKLFQRQKDFL